jgi:Ca2+-binding EF-hand superfamily protein
VVQRASPAASTVLQAGQAGQAGQRGQRQQSGYGGQQQQQQKQGKGNMVAGTTVAGAALLAYGFLNEDRTAKCEDINIVSKPVDKREVKIWSKGSSTAAGKIMEYKRISAKKMKEGGHENAIDFENRIRQYSTPDQTFNYFAKFLVSQKNSTGGTIQWVMMSPMDMFNAMTPEGLHSESVIGTGNYISVESEDLHLKDSNVLDHLKKSPVQDSILNAIGENGLITYNDFCFLLTILSTPRRYISTAFELFDINGDGVLDAKEFSFTNSKLSYNPGGFGDYDITQADQTYKAEKLQDRDSGLLNILFGKDRTSKVTLTQFSEFIQKLQDEMIELEFKEYDKSETGRITEVDLASFLLKHAKVPAKQEKKMIKRVKNTWPQEYKNRGVSLQSFKNLYQALAGGEDLQRAMLFLDKGEGVDYEEFQKIFKWVSKQELSDHVAKVMFVLFDNDMDGMINKEDIQNVLFNWRKARGLEKLGINATMGHKKTEIR